MNKKNEDIEDIEDIEGRAYAAKAEAIDEYGLGLAEKISAHLGNNVQVAQKAQDDFFKSDEGVAKYNEVKKLYNEFNQLEALYRECRDDPTGAMSQTIADECRNKYLEFDAAIQVFETLGKDLEDAKQALRKHEAGQAEYNQGVYGGHSGSGGEWVLRGRAEHHQELIQKTQFNPSLSHLVDNPPPLLTTEDRHGQFSKYGNATKSGQSSIFENGSVAEADASVEAFKNNPAKKILSKGESDTKGEEKEEKDDKEDKNEEDEEDENDLTAGGAGDALDQMNDILNEGPKIGDEEKLFNAVKWMGKKICSLSDTNTETPTETCEASNADGLKKLDGQSKNSAQTLGDNAELVKGLAGPTMGAM